MNRAEELEAIAAFIAAHGVVRCPAKYALPTLAYLPMVIAAQRLAELKVRTSDSYAWLQVAARIFVTGISRH
jgi:hypothetical protein